MAFLMHGDLGTISYAAPLRAVVGGTGKLPMTELKAMCEAAGFASVRTYIASGNVVFTSKLGEKGGEAGRSSMRLQDYAGKPVGVLVRSAALKSRGVGGQSLCRSGGQSHRGDFPGCVAASDGVGRRSPVAKDERLALGKREIYVHYGDGMADSRLKIPGAKSGTARNMNTIAAGRYGCRSRHGMIPDITETSASAWPRPAWPRRSTRG